MRAFTRREKIMLGALSVMILGVAYFFLFFTPMQDRISEAETRIGTARDQLVVAQVKVVQLNQMKQELAKMKAEGVTIQRQLPVYNNLDKIMVELNGIMLAADKFKMDFPDPDTTQSIILRPSNVTFEAGNYTTAKNIIQQLSDCIYRCSINGVNMSADTSGMEAPPGYEVVGDLNTMPVKVGVDITFYEKQPPVQTQQPTA